MGGQLCEKFAIGCLNHDELVKETVGNHSAQVVTDLIVSKETVKNAAE